MKYIAKIDKNPHYSAILEEKLTYHIIFIMILNNIVLNNLG